MSATAAEDMQKFLDKISTLRLEDFCAQTITPLEELQREAHAMKCCMELYVTHLQHELISKLQSYEPEARFNVDRWSRNQGGGGITVTLQNGVVFEKAAVNISVVHGEMHEDQVRSMGSKTRDLKVEGRNTYFATGISSVIHPANPFVPTMHFNYRYFELTNVNSGDSTWWFGGGSDITPYYLIEQDIVHFHKTLKDACDIHGKDYYPKFKKMADDYFYIKHRGEHRGLGGIFFDDMNDRAIEECFAFVVSMGNAVLPSYVPMIDARKDNVFSDTQRQWQLLRRGRYVEFNLVYDRGTKFGLATPGCRIESIFVSMPLNARWEYMPDLEAGDEELKLMVHLKKPKEWV